MERKLFAKIIAVGKDSKPIQPGHQSTVYSLFGSQWRW